MRTINFNPLQQEDISLLFQWFTQPYIATWWPEPTNYLSFKKKWLARIDTKLTEKNNSFNGYLIIINKISIGYIQYCCITTEDRIGYPPLAEHSVGLDFFIGNQDYLGKQLSVPILTQFVETIVKKNEPSTTMLIIDPAPTNLRAIHVYKKSGFKEIGIFQRPYGLVFLMYKYIR